MQSIHLDLFWWRKLWNHFAPMIAHLRENVLTALVYVIMNSRQMIVRRTFTKYQRFLGNKIERKCYTRSILGLHPRDETAMLVYKTIENVPTRFA